MSESITELERRRVVRLSNEKTNRLTRECLQTALIHLMAEKDLDKISVTELVARAGVSRTAFYSNYSSKEEILTRWLADSVERLCALTREALQKGRAAQVYTLLFDQIRRDVDGFSALFRANLQEQLFSRLEESVLTQFTPYDTQTKYLITAWCGALDYVIVRWVREGMREPSHEIAGLCVEFTEPFIRTLRLKYPAYFAPPASACPSAGEEAPEND